MRYEPERSYHTVIGWKDPRTESGELMWPERFGEEEVKSLEIDLGPYAASGQLQQRPEPKGGGIIKREWWRLWEADSYPPNKVVVLMTGSQGEEFAALSRAANKSHKKFGIKKGDTIILSASFVPGNERAVQKIKDNPIEIPEKDRTRIEQDIRDLAGIIEEDAPVILDIESIRVTGEGKFELDLIKLFSRQHTKYRM